MSGFSIIPAAFNAIGGGIKSNDELYAEQMRAQQQQTPGLVYGEAQQPNRDEAMTPSKVVRPVDRLAMGGYNPMEQVFAGALEGEKSLYQPSTGPVVGASAEFSPAMTRYLNYMNYRRGY